MNGIQTVDVKHVNMNWKGRKYKKVSLSLTWIEAKALLSKNSRASKQLSSKKEVSYKGIARNLRIIMNHLLKIIKQRQTGSHLCLPSYNENKFHIKNP